MKKLPLLAPLFLLLLGAGSTTEDAKLAYAPEAGLTLIRTHDAKGNYSLVRVVISMGDEEMEADENTEGWTGLDVEFTEHIAVTDELLAIGDGRPEKLRRTFDSLGQNVTYTPGEGEGMDLEYTSDLEEKTVSITWNEETEEYDFAPAEDQEIDVDLLELLDEDMDLRGFLPGTEVAEGDEWELGLDAYLPLSWMGGDLSFACEDEPEDESNTELSHLLREAAEAEGTATFARLREEEGATLAVIEFEIETSAAAEVELDIEAVQHVEGAYRGREVTSTIEGTLLWDVKNNHLHSLEASARSTIALIERAELDFNGETLEQIQTQYLEGEATQTYTIEG